MIQLRTYTVFVMVRLTRYRVLLTIQCSEPVILNQSWYMWNVEPRMVNASRQGDLVEQHQFQVPDDEM